MAVDGTYNIEMNTPMGKRTSKLMLKTDGGSLSGTYTGEQGESAFQGGTVTGEDVSFSVKVGSPVGEITLGVTGTVSGDTISGQVQLGSYGSTPFQGTRA